MAPMTQVLQRKIILTDCGPGTPVLRLVEASSGAGSSILAVPTPGTTTTAAPHIVCPQVGYRISDKTVDSRDDQTYGDLSEIVDELFDQIAIHLDITSAVRLAACSKDFCWKLVAYHEVHDHKIACPHSPCPCTEPGCEFAAPPPALLTHLREAHSIEVHSFHYDKVLKHESQPVPAQGSPRIQIIGSGDDGTVFAIQFDTHNTETLVSVVCVRSAACLSPWYKVRLWSNFSLDGGKEQPERWAEWPERWESEFEEEEEEMEDQIPLSASFFIEFEPRSNALPEVDRKHMTMIWKIMRLQEPLQTMDYFLSILKIDETDNAS